MPSGGAAPSERSPRPKSSVVRTFGPTADGGVVLQPNVVAMRERMVIMWLVRGARGSRRRVLATTKEPRDHLDDLDQVAEYPRMDQPHAPATIGSPGFVVYLIVVSRSLTGVRGSRATNKVSSLVGLFDTHGGSATRL
jgi:hypothetical protein